MITATLILAALCLFVVTDEPDPDRESAVRVRHGTDD